MREDEMDIEMVGLDTFLPGRVFVPLRPKTKTTKTP